MSRYEQLRAAVLGGSSGGLAHALLRQRGMAWWARAWQQAGLPRRRAASAAGLPAAGILPRQGAELTRLLAGMALNSIREEGR